MGGSHDSLSLHHLVQLGLRVCGSHFQAGFFTYFDCLPTWPLHMVSASHNIGVFSPSVFQKTGSALYTQSELVLHFKLGKGSSPYLLGKSVIGPAEAPRRDKIFCVLVGAGPG